MTAEGRATHHVSTFQRRFLAVRGYERPTGNPLYTYRATPDEFSELEAGLREYLSHSLRYQRLAEIVRGRAWISALFVLYSAEWWRREYDGSGWTWEPILSRLGIASDGWKQSQRSECVEEGLRAWGIGLCQARGFRYLGTIALQGGLPMKLLAAAQGNIGRVLLRVLQLATSAHIGEAEIEEWVRSLSDYLPRIYQQSEIFRLLAQVITTTLSLRATAALHSAEGAIAKLDATIPEWRQRFPLPMEDEQARALIEKLVRESVGARAPTATAAVVNRRLDNVADGWELSSRVTLPEYLETDSLKLLFEFQANTSLTRSMTLRFEAGERTFEVGCRRLAGRETYRIERSLPELNGPDAAAEHAISLLLATTSQPMKKIKHGEQLDPGLPWLFQAEEDGSAKFVRQASGSVSSTEGIICAPRTWTIESEAGVQVEPSGPLKTTDRLVWRFRGSVRVRDELGATFRVRSGNAYAEDEQFFWSGSRALDVQFLSPPLAFRGTPKLCQVSSDENVRIVSGSTVWKIGTVRTLVSTALLGPVEATWPANGDVKWRCRMILMGDAKPLNLLPGATPFLGTLVFTGWRLARIASKNTDVVITSNIDGDSLIATVAFTGAGSPPEWCDVELLWRGNPVAAGLLIPFPARGSRCFGPNGRELPGDALLPAEKLYGVRLVAFVGGRDQAVLQLHLSDGKEEVDTICYHLAPQLGESRIEVRLIDHLPRIQRMLASEDALNAYVRVELQVGSSPGASLRIARYSCDLVRKLEPPSILLPTKVSRSLPQASIVGLEAMAIQLNALGEEPLRLKRSELDADIAWEFPAKELDPGPWLICPEPDSPILFRPTLWTISDDSLKGKPSHEAELSLSEIMTIPDSAARRSPLSFVIARLAEDFQHIDWIVLERLAVVLHHLPLCSLDVWRVLSRSSRGLASLALRALAFPAGFLERISNELPCFWEGIGMTTWVAAMKAFDSYHRDNPMVTPSLEQRIEAITSLQPSLWALLELAQTLVSGRPTLSVQAAATGQIDFFESLFYGDDCPFQRLLREGAEVVWPTDISPDFIRRAAGPAAKFLRFSDPRYRDSVVNVPILLAISATLDLNLDWIDESRLRVIRRYQDFCPEWFRDAFDSTVARCIAEKAVNISRS
jgi:hypothetical protein